MKVLFGLAAGAALTLAIKAEPTPIAVALSAAALGSVSTLFLQAEARSSRRRVMRAGLHPANPPKLTVIQGGKKRAFFKDPMTSSPWTSK